MDQRLHNLNIAILFDPVVTQSEKQPCIYGPQNKSQYIEVSVA